MNSLNTKLITGAAAILLASGAVAGPKEIATQLLTKGLAGDKSLIMENVAEGYIQHNPQAPDKRSGLLDYVDYLQSLDTPASVTPVRVLQEGNLVVVQSELSLAGPKVVFDLFRFEDGKIAEHWDGIQDMPENTVSGRTMLDGQTEITDRDKTAANKALVLGLVTDVLMNGKVEKITEYIGEAYLQHNPQIADGLAGLGAFMGYLAENKISFSYRKIHNVVAEGNFVFTQSEGELGGVPQAFYDLFRVENGKVVEHWDVIQEVPAKMAHGNGMF